MGGYSGYSHSLILIVYILIELLLSSHHSSWECGSHHFCYFNALINHPLLQVPAISKELLWGGAPISSVVASYNQLAIVAPSLKSPSCLMGRDQERLLSMVDGGVKLDL